jgi:glycosyltransferase involved in cell wall biosynthesis
MRPPRAAFAIPGDLDSMTGGYFYDRKVIAGLRALGREVHHLPLGASFPDPTRADTEDAARQLAAVHADCPVIIDGLALGALDPAALRGMTAPMVAMVHHPLALETGLSHKRRDHLFRTEKANLARAAHILVPSPRTAEVVMSEYDVSPERLTVARPGTDRKPVRRCPVAPPLILSVGIQVPRKGHDVLLRALAGLTDRPWQAAIVGAAQGPACAADLAALVDRLGLEHRVRLTGRIDDAALGRLYAQASVFALATRHEGYGIVFDEAMLHGLPIVSCRVGAVPDTVDPGAGLLVPTDDPEAFSRALARVLDEPATREAMAAASAAAGRRLPGWDSTAQIIDAVLTGAARGAHAGG